MYVAMYKYMYDNVSVFLFSITLIYSDVKFCFHY